MEEIIDLGTTKFNIEEEWYKKFCNKYEKEEVKKSSRAVFQYDWQRFLWAFILGISVEKLLSLLHRQSFPFLLYKILENIF